MIQAPLSEMPDHIASLCDRLGLGAPDAELEQVPGGFHHRMWRLATDCGLYAVKQLSPEVAVNEPETIAHYDATETVAEAFAGRGITALHALGRGSKYLQIIGDTGYLVYPWTDAVAIDRKNLSEAHALRIAAVLARMHAADIEISGLRETVLENHPEAKIIELIEWATSRNARDYKHLEAHLQDFLHIAARQEAARAVLQQHTVISHGDLDQKNVLWDDMGEPLLIDWESARRMNPTHEALLVALDWAGITSAFESPLFEKFITAYRGSGGIIDGDAVQPAFDRIQGNWLNWLMFNVGRSFDIEDDGQRALGAEQVDLALATLLRLERVLPRLVDRVRQCDGPDEVIDV